MSKNTSNKIYCLMPLIILICILFTSCRLSAKMPETVEINGIMYKAAISASLYPLTEVADKNQLMDEIIKYSPAEIICNDAFMVSGIPLEELRNRLGICINSLEPHFFDEEQCKKILLKH